MDITESVQDIATGAKENHGLVLTCPEQGMAATIYGPQIHYIDGFFGKNQDLKIGGLENDEYSKKNKRNIETLYILYF